MQSEVTIIVKNSEKTLRSKHLLHSIYAADPTDETLRPLIDEAKKQFKANDEMVAIDDIQLKIHIEVI